MPLVDDRICLGTVRAYPVALYELIGSHVAGLVEVVPFSVDLLPCVLQVGAAGQPEPPAIAVLRPAGYDCLSIPGSALCDVIAAAVCVGFHDPVLIEVIPLTADLFPCTLRKGLVHILIFPLSGNLLPDTLHGAGCLKAMDTVSDIQLHGSFSAKRSKIRFAKCYTAVLQCIIFILNQILGPVCCGDHEIIRLDHAVHALGFSADGEVSEDTVTDQLHGAGLHGTVCHLQGCTLVHLDETRTHGIYRHADLHYQRLLRRRLDRNDRLRNIRKVDISAVLESSVYIDLSGSHNDISRIYKLCRTYDLLIGIDTDIQCTRTDILIPDIILPGNLDALMISDRALVGIICVNGILVLSVICESSHHIEITLQGNGTMILKSSSVLHQKECGTDVTDHLLLGCLCRILGLRFCLGSFDIDHTVVDHLAAILDRDLTIDLLRRWLLCRIRDGRGIELHFICTGLIDDEDTVLLYHHGGVISDGKLRSCRIRTVHKTQLRIAADGESSLILLCIICDLDIEAVHIQDHGTFIICRSLYGEAFQYRHLTDQLHYMGIIFLIGDGLGQGPEFLYLIRILLLIHHDIDLKVRTLDQILGRLICCSRFAVIKELRQKCCDIIRLRLILHTVDGRGEGRHICRLIEGKIRLVILHVIYVEGKLDVRTRSICRTCICAGGKLAGGQDDHIEIGDLFRFSVVLHGLCTLIQRVGTGLIAQGIREGAAFHTIGCHQRLVAFLLYVEVFAFTCICNDVADIHTDDVVGSVESAHLLVGGNISVHILDLLVDNGMTEITVGSYTIGAFLERLELCGAHLLFVIHRRPHNDRRGLRGGCVRKGLLCNRRDPHGCGSFSHAVSDLCLHGIYTGKFVQIDRNCRCFIRSLFISRFCGLNRSDTLHNDEENHDDRNNE